MAGRLEAGLGTGDAGKAAAQAGAAAIPGAQIAVGMRLGALATEVFHQAAKVGLLLGARLEFVIFVARAAVMHQFAGVEQRPPEFVQVAVGHAFERQLLQRLDDPARMRRATGDIDHRQTAGRAETGAEQAARRLFVVLQATGFERIARRIGRKAAISRTGTDREHPFGLPGQTRHPFGERPAVAGHQVEATAAVRAAQHGAFDTQHIEGLLATGAGFEDGQGFAATGLRQGRMPDKLDTGIAQFVEQGTRLRAEQRLRAAAATTALQPEDFHASGSSP